MHRSFLARAALALAALLAGAGAAHAAPARAADSLAAPPIVGVVRDTAGVPLSNARVVINELNRSTLTRGDGSFVFRSLRPGTYHIDVTLLGYASGHAVAEVPAEGADVRVAIVMRPTVLSLESINVTASPRSADPLNITQSTAELSGKALERNLGTSVAQTLSAQPGLSVRYGGPAASTPVIRGLAGERVLVVQNGQRTGDLSSTSADHALSIDPLAASRIEVVRGPASLLYGNNALGGVVNVIASDIPTTIPGEASGFLAMQGESVNPGAAVTGEVTLPVGPTLALSARGGGRRVDDVRTGGGGVLDNTFYNNLYGTAGLGYVSERLQGGASLGGYLFDYGLAAADHEEEGHEGEEEGEHEEGVTIEGHRVEGSGRLDLALGSRGFTDVRLDGNTQFYGHDEIEGNGEIGTRFRLNTQSASLTAKTAYGVLDGAIGVSGLFKQYSPEGEEALTPGAGSATGGVFVYQELPLTRAQNAPSLQAGARYDVYDVSPDEIDDERFAGARERRFDSFSGSLGLNVPLSDQFSASVSVARSFRAPTVEELFSNGFHHAAGTYDVGDPDLVLETNRGAEAVLRGQSGRINAQLAAFYNRIDDYITADVVGDTTIEHEGHEDLVPLNRFRQADAELRGVEGQAEVVVARNLVVGAMGDLVRGDFVSGGALPFMPASRLGANVRWDDGRYSLGLDARHAFAQDRAELEEFRTDAFTLVNATAGLSLRRGRRIHSITLRADNLLDEEYREPTSRLLVSSPGRNLSLVYRVLF